MEQPRDSKGRFARKVKYEFIVERDAYEYTDQPWKGGHAWGLAAVIAFAVAALAYMMWSYP